MRTASEFMSVFAVHGLLTPATWRPFGGSPYSINGEFKAPVVMALGMVEATGPCFEVAGADVPNIAHGDSLTIDEPNEGAGYYKIVGVETQSGKGFTLLRLEDQA